MAPSHHPHFGASLAPPSSRASSVPAQHRPSNSRHHSATSLGSNLSSVSRRPHPQHTEYIPNSVGIATIAGGEGDVSDGILEQALFDAEEAAAELENPDEGEGSDTEHLSSDYDEARDGSISRRPPWRRPSPYWILPFLTVLAAAMGMTAAPRSEMYISLACLAHPPQQPSDVQPNSWDAMLRLQSVFGEIGTPVWIGDEATNINISLPVAPSPLPSKQPVSAVDQWFIKVQREMYDYRESHQHHPSDSAPSQTTSATSTRAMPTGPLPKPTFPGGDSLPSQTPADGDKDSPRPGEGKKTDTKTPYHEIDPKLCKKDPKVQAAAAKLNMAMILTSGCLSAFTTAYWGKTSDRIGRTKILALGIFGILLSEVCFLLVATFPYLAPGGYRALLIGPFFEGMLGGFSTIMATLQAYTSDTTDNGSRTAVFARLGGIMMAGFAVGPVLGSFVISWSNNILTPFYFCAAIQLLSCILYVVLLPESLSSDARRVLAKNAKLAQEAAKRRDVAEREWENETPTHEPADPLLNYRTSDSASSRAINPGYSKTWKRTVGNSRRTLRKMTGFIDPLAIFLPKEREDAPGKDWSLTFVGMTIFFISLMFGIMQVKTQFAIYSFGWTSAQLGPYMSAMGFTRGSVLLVLLPVAMRFIRPRFIDDTPAPAEETAGSSGSLASSDATLSSHGSRSPTKSIKSPTGKSTQPAIPATTSAPVITHRSARLDLWTARFGLFVQFLAYVLISLNPTETEFVLISLVATFGAFDGPAINSLALSLVQTAESNSAGKLFGAFSVIHSLGSALVSPLLFGNLFAYTVGWYAPSVFVLAAFFCGAAQVCMWCIRLPGEEDGAKLAERGRSRKVKMVRSSSSTMK